MNLPPLVVLQQELHTHQYLYCNGENLTKLSKLCYPLLKYHCVNTDRLCDAARRAGIPLTIPQNGVIADHAYAAFLATLHTLLNPRLRFPTTTRHVRIHRTYVEWQRQARQCPELKAVLAFCAYAQQHLRPFTEEIFLIGSIATLDYTAWSDCDVVMVVRERVLSSPESLHTFQRHLLRANALLLLHDPLQHHGCHLTSLREFAQYPQTFMPLEVFADAIPLFGTRTLTFHVRAARAEARALCTALFTTIRDMVKVRSMSTYVLKNFSHLVSFIPCAALNARGIFASKGECFRKLRAVLSADEYEPLAMVTRVRQEWRTIPLPRLIARMLAELPSHHPLRLAGAVWNRKRSHAFSPRTINRLLRRLQP